MCGHSNANLAYAADSLAELSTFASNSQAPHLTAASGMVGADTTHAGSAEAATHAFILDAISSEEATYIGMMGLEDAMVAKAIEVGELQEVVYARQVVLHLDHTDRPVEYGAIQIHLPAFPEAAQDAIREGKRPLGGILADYELSHHSRPSAYFSLPADDLMTEIFDLAETPTLYGRRNTLLSGEGEKLAEILEILPELMDRPGA